MSTYIKIVRNSFTSLVVVLQVCAFPLAAYAEDATSSSTAPASTTTTQPSQPVEPAPAPQPVPQPPAPENPVSPSPSPTLSPSTAPTTTSTQPVATPTTTAPSNRQAPTGPNDPYVLNPATGKYENSTYIWDPVTYKTTPKTAPKEYSLNPTSGAWETPKYAYDPSAGTYAPNIPLANSGLNNNFANDPYHGVDFHNNSPTSYYSGFYNASISNNIYSRANSGNASVTQNTAGGNALSGNAAAMANLLNLLQTSFSPGGSGSVGTFVANIDGDVVGDIMIDPGQISKKSVNVANSSNNPDLKINVENNADITNNIDLAATSGNATVSKNTQGGNATTGTATAIANVVNMINSSVSAGQSFFGIVNINGNFNGDILMPPNALDYLLASSAPRTTVDVASLGDKKLTANLTNNQTINNNVNASAQSGNATVSRNTEGGNATTGKASTNVTILNLTGSNVIGSNSLLVFVNVMGKWVGLIVDAPAGSTSAAYAGGVKTNSSLPGYNNVDISGTNNSTITNNINVAARSGDAEVSNNTMGGDATSGNAKAGANILNIMNSNLAFSDWFGVLFINVLGSWNGSFGIDTAAGNKPTQRNENSNNSQQPPTLVQFVPGGNGSENSNYSYSYSDGNNIPVYPASFYGDIEITDGNDKQQAVLAASAAGSGTGPLFPTAASTQKRSVINWGVASASLLILLIALGAERFIASRRQAELITAETIEAR